MRVAAPARAQPQSAVQNTFSRAGPKSVLPDRSRRLKIIPNAFGEGPQHAGPS
jgi:hypothetical protein